MELEDGNIFAMNNKKKLGSKRGKILKAFKNNITYRLARFAEVRIMKTIDRIVKFTYSYLNENDTFIEEEWNNVLNLLKKKRQLNVSEIKDCKVFITKLGNPHSNNYIKRSWLSMKALSDEEIISDEVFFAC